MEFAYLHWCLLPNLKSCSFHRIIIVDWRIIIDLIELLLATDSVLLRAFPLSGLESIFQIFLLQQPFFHLNRSQYLVLL